MGTRSLTTFIQTWTDKEKQKKRTQKIVTVYRQFDGYPTGHGMELAEFLTSGEMVNGIGGQQHRVFNGIGCLIAQFIKDFKDGAGGIYVHRGGTTNMWEDYHYHVIFNHDTQKLTMKCIDVSSKVLFNGDPADFIKKYKEEEVTT